MLAKRNIKASFSDFLVSYTQAATGLADTGLAETNSLAYKLSEKKSILEEN